MLKPANSAFLTRPEPLLPPPHAKRAPFDNEYLFGLVWRQRGHLGVAFMALLFCTSSNLAAPVLSGMLFETLIQQQPVDKYAQVDFAAWPPGLC